MALKDHMQARVAELLDRVAELEKDNAALDKENEMLAADLHDSEREVEMCQHAIRDDEHLKTEIVTLHEFIADVRLGIRDLSEYEEVCRRAGLVA